MMLRRPFQEQGVLLCRVFFCISQKILAFSSCRYLNLLLNLFLGILYFRIG